MTRFLKLYLGKLRCFLKERFRRYLESRSDRSAYVLGFLRDRAESRGCAEIYYDERAAVLCMSCDRIDDPVRSDLLGIIVFYNDPRLYTCTYNYRLAVEIFYRKMLERI